MYGVRNKIRIFANSLSRNMFVNLHCQLIFTTKILSLCSQKISKLQPVTRLLEATLDTNKIQYNHSLGFHFDKTYFLLIGIDNIGLE